MKSKTSLKLKHDGYRRARGGYSRLLEIHCESCKAFITEYQKDGAGPLKRMYLDRIITPAARMGTTLICKKCKQILGMKYIYEKEHRPAFRLFEGAVTKKIKKPTQEISYAPRQLR